MGYKISNSDIWYNGFKIDSDFLNSPFLIKDDGNIMIFNSIDEKYNYLKTIKEKHYNKEILLDKNQLDLLNELLNNIETDTIKKTKKVK